MPDNKSKTIKVMNEYLYEEQLKNEKFEMLVNTKEILTKEEVDFVISWDCDERQNMFFLNENEFLNLNVYSEHDHEKRNEDDVNNLPKDMPGFEGTWDKLNDLCNV